MNIGILKYILSTFIDNLESEKHSYNYGPNKIIYKKVNEKYPDLFISTAELIFLKNNFGRLKDLHIFCPICGKKNKFTGCKTGYQKYCSAKCNNNSIETRNKMRKTWKHTWNLKSDKEIDLINEKIYNTKKKNGTLPSSDIVINKFRNTMKNKSMEEKRLKREREYKTRQNNNTLPNSFLVREKFNSTIKKRTDEQRKLIKQKEYNTRLKNGTLPGNTISITKFKTTWSKKSTNDINNIMKKSFYTKSLNGTLPSSQKVVEKTRNTWKNKSRNEIKNIIKKQKRSKLINGTLPSNKDIIYKMFTTKKKNGTLGGPRSKAEIRCYKKAKIKFPEIKHSYYEDPRYPFNCDMYIPSQDLFIECHFSQYHHYKPFDENCIGDLVELGKLKNKLNDEYLTKNQIEKTNNIITTWTKRDPLKLETFKKNNLNYKIFYTEKEFNDWLKVK